MGAEAMSEWRTIDSAPLGVEIETKIDDAEHGPRNETTLIGERRGFAHRTMWFLPDMSMYVYYEPTHWRPKQQRPAGR